MLLTKEKSIDEQIVEYLLANPGSTIEQIMSQVTPMLKKPVSLQAWYQVLKRLQADYIVIKVNKTYRLNMSWLKSVERWSRVLFDKETKEGVEEDFGLPKREGVVKEFKFKDLLAMNAFWAHILVYLANKYKDVDNDLFGLLPRYWFYIAQETQEKQYIQNLKAAGCFSYHLINARSYLDEWNLEQVDKEVSSYYMSPKSIEKSRRKYYNVLGDYIMEVRISKKASAIIDKSFEEINAFDGSARRAIAESLSQKLPCQFLVYKDSNKREKLKKKVSKYF